VPEDERPPRAAALSAPGLAGEGWLELLALGEVEVLGRMPYSSNATFLVELTLGEVTGGAIYKPLGGERPLWDFPDGLFRREVAAYALAEGLGIGMIPETVGRRDAPFGLGSLQRFIDADPERHYFALHDEGGHEEPLRRLAGLDLLLNNADRKGGHVLVDADGALWGIDNGLSFHVEPKLRTVMWDFAGEEVPEEILGACRQLRDALPPALEGLLDEEELAALVERAEAVLRWPAFPAPTHRRAYPWPLL